MYKIISDSACDLFEEYTDAHDVHIVPLYVSFDGEHFLKEREDVDHNEFYRQMVEEGAYPKSSLPSIQDYIDTFTPYAKEGLPIICICISTLFSGSFNSATTAKSEVLEEYPDAKITVINSMQNTVSQALMVNEAVRMRDANIPYEDAVKKLEELKETGRIFFTIDSMDYLKRGGRVGKMTAVIGNTLNIKPLIILKNGELNVGGISRTRSKAKKSMLTACKKHFEENNLDCNDYYFSIGTGYDFDEAREYKKEVEELMGVKCLPYLKTRIGAATACHTGPHALGIGIIKRYDA
ncbi:MAG: DegV family protein [bacterium]|nr:DegV family protein [bacterium]